jgi:HSP20 family protein
MLARHVLAWHGEDGNVFDKHRSVFMQRVIYLRRRAGHDQQEIQQQLERMFQRQWGKATSMIVVTRARDVWHPPADMYETTAAFVVKVELPGMRDADIEVTLDERSLHIRGVRLEQRDDKLQYYHQMGINYGAFEVEVFLARPVDYEHVTARYDDGFLFVELPKPFEGERVQVPVQER